VTWKRALATASEGIVHGPASGARQPYWMAMQLAAFCSRFGNSWATMQGPFPRTPDSRPRAKVGDGDFSGLVVWCRLDHDASEGGIRPTGIGFMQVGLNKS
jgi:hypothetical protein